MGDFERDYAFCADARPTDYIAPAATFMGYRRADGRAATRNYIGIVTTVNCSAATSRMIAAQARADARPVSQHRRRRAAHPWRRLRHGGVRPRDGRAAPHARGLHAPSQHGGGGGAGARLRDQPDRRPDERRRIEGRAEADPDGHPGRGRRVQDRDARRRLPEGAAARGQRRQARADPGQRIDPGAAVRRVGRLFRHLRQSRAGRGGRPAGAPWRHGGAVGDAGDLRRRASADAARGQPRGRREDRRAASNGGKTIARAPAGR